MADKVIPETGCSDLGIVLLYVAGGWNLWLMYGRGCWGVDGCHGDDVGREVNEAWKEVTKEVGRSVGNVAVGVIKIHSDSRSCWEGHDHDCEFVFVYLYP